MHLQSITVMKKEGKIKVVYNTISDGTNCNYEVTKKLLFNRVIDNYLHFNLGETELTEYYSKGENFDYNLYRSAKNQLMRKYGNWRS